MRHVSRWWTWAPSGLWAWSDLPVAAWSSVRDHPTEHALTFSIRTDRGCLKFSFWRRSEWGLQPRPDDGLITQFLERHTRFRPPHTSYAAWSARSIQSLMVSGTALRDAKRGTTRSPGASPVPVKVQPPRDGYAQRLRGAYRDSWGERRHFRHCRINRGSCSLGRRASASGRYPRGPRLRPCKEYWSLMDLNLSRSTNVHEIGILARRNFPTRRRGLRRCSRG